MKIKQSELYQIGISDDPQGEFDTEISIQCTKEFAREVSQAGLMYKAVGIVSLDDADALASARSVLTEHADTIELAKGPRHQKSQMQNRFAIALVALADALEAGNEN